MDILRREFIYVWYYFSIQLQQIFRYWVLGMVLGSAISVFGKNKIHSAFSALGDKKLGVLGLIPASLLGIASPLCMYGTIPIAASFSQKGMKDDMLAAFMMSSILLNPQLLIYSAALGRTAMAIRFVSCFLCGVGAGLCVRYFYRGKSYFDFKGFESSKSRDTDPNLLLRFLKNLGRNIKATGPWFLFGVLLSALFQRYVPAEAFGRLFGENKGFGVLMAATVGVPLYACGGGTIPLLQQWLVSGMSMGSASAFMITGPATKITNLGALKIVLGIRRFVLYLVFVMLFSLVTGLLVDQFGQLFR
ncbi:MAG: permease [Lachnospiraceae bacterium]|nr:permease [Lachnospiraceae bacterium]